MYAKLPKIQHKSPPFLTPSYDSTQFKNLYIGTQNIHVFISV